MKKYFLSIAIIFCSFNAFATKGLYVDGFASIVGNTVKEDSLLNYAEQNGFTYLALYELHLVHAANNLTSVGSSAPLATFINKAKTLYGISEVGACGENFWWFDNIISVYNNIHSDPNEKIDVYNFEFEFWNTFSVGAGQYYCTTYLSPGGYSCDTAGAFAFYMKELKSIDSLANLDGAISEIYVGWFNQHQATQMITKADRILLHSYVNNVSNVYSYTQTRLSYLGNGSGVVDVMPIFSSEPSFLGPWLNSNPEVNAYANYTTGFTNETGVWKANINLLGYQWFAYSFMPYGLPAAVENFEDMGQPVYPNPLNDMLKIANENGDFTALAVFNSIGELVHTENSSSQIIQLDLSDLPNDIYHLLIKRNGMTISEKLIKN